MGHPTDRQYSKEHEWVVVDGDTATVGITNFAQDQLGEVVYVDLQVSAGDTVTAGETFGEIESVKSVSELFAPVSGEVVEVNDFDGSEQTINADPHGDGWMIKVKLDDAGEVDGLMAAEEYDTFVTEG